MSNISASTESMPAKVREYMPVLDGFRGIAISVVFLFPCHPTLKTTPPGWLNQFYKQLMASGWCGVDAFFVLSGFLITGILLDVRDQPHFSAISI